MSRLSRIAVACGAVTIGLFAGSQSFALAIADRQPDLALQFDSTQPQALANNASNGISGGQVGDRRQSIRAQAIEAIQRDPMEVRAYVALALLRQAEGGNTTRSLISYAQSLSRRNLSAQLWLIEDWAARGDIARTLQHYDIAMRSGSSAPSLLFPILVSASSDPIIATELAHVLAENPAWGEQLVQQIAQSSTDFTGITDLFIAMSKSGARIPDVALSAATTRMAEVGELAEAWRAYRAVRPQQAAQPMRNTAFAINNDPTTVFDWQLQDGSLSATMGDGTLYLSAAAGIAGVAARQVATLSPGTWRIDFRHDAGELRQLPILTVSCTNSGAMMGQSRRVGEGLARLTFTVPSSCTFQDVSFTLPSNDQPGGASASVHGMEIQREPT